MRGQSQAASGGVRQLLGPDRFVEVDPVVAPTDYRLDRLSEDLIGMAKANFRKTVSELGDKHFLEHRATVFSLRATPMRRMTPMDNTGHDLLNALVVAGCGTTGPRANPARPRRCALRGGRRVPRRSGDRRSNATRRLCSPRGPSRSARPPNRSGGTSSIWISCVSCRFRRAPIPADVKRIVGERLKAQRHLRGNAAREEPLLAAGVRRGVPHGHHSRYPGPRRTNRGRRFWSRTRSCVAGRRRTRKATPLGSWPVPRSRPSPTKRSVRRWSRRRRHPTSGESWRFRSSCSS